MLSSKLLVAFITFMYVSLSQAQQRTVTICTANTLADYWCDPAWYPESNWEALNTTTRRVAIKNWFDTHTECDIISIQESQEDMNEWYVANVFPPANFYFHYVYNSLDYWSSWFRTDGTPYQKNGVALVVRKDAFHDCVWGDLDLRTGNHASTGVCVHTTTGVDFRVAAIHFDSDTGGGRKKEAEEVMAWMGPSNGVQVIAGDFNAGIDVTNLQNVVIGNANTGTNGGANGNSEPTGFIDPLVYFGITAQTHPWTDSDGNRRYGQIDYVVPRFNNANRNSSLPFDQGGAQFYMNNYTIWNAGVEELYPENNGGQDHVELLANRTKATLELLGSDHYYGSLTLSF